MRHLFFGIIIAVHVLIVCFFLLGGELFSGNKKKGQTDIEDGIENVEDFSEPYKETEKKYTENYFQLQNHQLPAELQRLVGNCRAAAVIDMDRKILLWGKEYTKAYPLASLTKMITALLAMESLEKEGSQLSLESPIRVSVAASKVEGRKVWLDPRETFTFDELLKCMLIRSANDCAFLLGEFIAGGDHDKFVAMMNSRAKELACNNFVLYNSHGLPHGANRLENLGNILELAFIAELLWEYPQIMKWTATRYETIREDSKLFQLDTTNQLLRSCEGVNGMKTGFTNQAGYCIVASCERQEKKMLAVVMGVDGKSGDKVRNEIAKHLLEWAYALNAKQAY